MEWIIPAILVFLILIVIVRNINVVQQSRAYVIERLGAFSKVWQVGIHFKVPFIERVAKKVSLKEQVLDYPPQPVITKDNVTMQIDTVVYFQITDPKLYAYGVEHPMMAMETLTATTLRNIIGDLELDQTLTSRDVINTKMRAILDEATDPWGIKVNRVELKNILPPQDIQNSMEKQMKAERDRRQALFTATVRQDGSSRFHKNNRWGLFPSFALGWKLKEEAFLKDVDVLSDLKLRLGYGITGQQNINSGDYPYLAVYETNKDGAYYPILGEGTTYRPNAYNPDLKWEKTTTYNVGLDFGFLNNRINGAVDYYYRKTTDLLNSVFVSAGTNFKNKVLSNVGSLENSGIEFSINSKPVVTTDWTWDLGFNITYNKNEITKLTTGDSENYYVAAGDNIGGGRDMKAMAHAVGHPASSFYVYQQVYDENGKPIENEFVDRNGDGTINGDDRYFYKKPTADVLMGLTSRLSYKSWDFSFSLRASLNNYVYNSVEAGGSDCNPTSVYSFGALNNRPLMGVANNIQNLKDNTLLSDYFVQNASFMKCDNITLGYSFKKLFGAPIGGRVYAAVQNVFTITKYKGLDPEVEKGLDNNIYPRPLTTLIGLSLNF